MSSRRVMFGVCLVGAAVAVGCGGDSGESTDSADTGAGATETTTSSTGDTQGATDSGAIDTGAAETEGQEVATGPGDASVEDTASADTAIADDTASADTVSEDTTGADGDHDGETSPACTEDEHCLAANAIAPPNLCAAAPRCVEGACVVAPPDCDDGDPCTLDGCDPRMGCVAFEQTYDLGSSRVWYCPGAVTGDAAGVECAARGAELALVTTPEESDAWGAIVYEQGASDAWVSPFSQAFCEEPRRVVIPPCQMLDLGGCTLTAACTEARPFLCQIACNDGDPCTRDFVGADGLCQTEPETCDDADLCTTDTCDPRDGCVHARPEGQCDDQVPCTTDRCDPLSGECVNTAVKTSWDATHDLLACPGPLTWSAARTRCAVEGAVLAMPTTDAQRGQLAAIAAGAGATAALWAPLKQRDGGNQPWDWTDGGGSGAPPWCASVQPNFSEAGYCGAWATDDACLVDAPCTELRSFGCVIDTSIP